MAIKAIHLDEQGVEGLLALIIPAAQASPALTTDGVDFVNEDDAGSELAGLFKRVADAGSTDADKHLNEVRAADAEERNLGLAGDSAGKERLTCTRRADHENPFRNRGTHLGEALRLAEKIDDFLNLFLRLIAASDVLKSRRFAVRGVQASPALGELHRALLGALQETIHEEQDHPRHQQGGQDVVQEHGQACLRRRLLEVLLGDRGTQGFEFFLGQATRGDKARLFIRGFIFDQEFAFDLIPTVGTRRWVRLYIEGLQFAFLGIGKHLGDAQFLDMGSTGGAVVYEQGDRRNQNDPDHQRSSVYAVTVLIILVVILAHRGRSELKQGLSQVNRRAPFCGPTKRAECAGG